MLNPNKCQEISLPISMKNLQFYRVGVLGDGRCLLHSLLFLLNTDYPTKSEEEKTQICNAFLEEITNGLTMDDWLHFSLGDASVFNVIMNCRDILEDVIDSDFLDTVFDGVSKLEDLSNICLDDDSHTQLFRNKVIPDVTRNLFEKYKGELLNCVDLGYQEIHYISSKYKINIIIFDQYNQIFQETKIDPSFQYTVLVSNQGGMHWEPVIFCIGKRFHRALPTHQLDFSFECK